MSSEYTAQLGKDAQKAKVELTSHLKNLPYMYSDSIVDYLTKEHLACMASCSQLSDDTKLRQAQGAARTYASLIDIFTINEAARRR